MHQLQTERLTLRPFTLDDFDPFAAMLADPEVMRFISADRKPLPRFGAWQSLTSIVGHWTLRGYGMFAVFERRTNTFVGRVGPWLPEGWPAFEIGWTLRSEMWGRGYATEAARTCVEFAFDTLQRDHVVSLILPDNARSIRVAERIGETFESRTTLPHLPADREVLQYGLSRRGWQRSHGGNV